MTIIDLMKKRYSVRQYKDAPIKKEDIDRILEAAKAAPTAANMQPQRIYVVNTTEGLEKLKRGTDYHHNTPLAFIICADKSKAWKRPFDGKLMTDIDASIVTDHMMLTAAELGLGTCWVTFFKKEVIQDEFQLPPDLEVINILTVGYADDIPASADRHDNMRLPLSETVSWDFYS